MKNNQKGFVIPLFIALIAVLAIGGGVYVYKQNKKILIVQNEVNLNASTTTDLNSNNKDVQTSSTVKVSTNITLDLSNITYEPAKAVIKEAWEKPADFDEHYVIAQIGCGTGCVSFSVIDKNTGKIYVVPVSNDLGQFTGNIGTPYFLQSNKIRVITENGSKLSIYAFDGSNFSLVFSSGLK